MKKVATLSAIPKGLSDFIALYPEERNWEVFSKHHRDAYKELKGELINVQGGICCYCELPLINHDSQIEHFHPKSPIDPARNWTTDPSNLMAACCGGVNSLFDGVDDDRFKKPCKTHMSCGQFKEDRFGPDMVDPRTLPDQPVVKVQSSGRLEAVESECTAHGVNYQDMCTTINSFLNLNSRRLVVARQKVYSEIQSATAVLMDDIEALELFIEDSLRPAGGRLPKFWTTVLCALAAN